MANDDLPENQSTPPSPPQDVTPPSSEPPFLYLTTTGWKTGKPHEIEIWFVSYQGCYYLCSDKRERSHWVQNIQRDPRVHFRVGKEGAVTQGKGRVVPPIELERLSALRERFDAKYQWSDGLMIELCPDSA